MGVLLCFFAYCFFFVGDACRVGRQRGRLIFDGRRLAVDSHLRLLNGGLHTGRVARHDVDLDGHLIQRIERPLCLLDLPRKVVRSLGHSVALDHRQRLAASLNADIRQLYEFHGIRLAKETVRRLMADAASWPIYNGSRMVRFWPRHTGICSIRRIGIHIRHAYQYQVCTRSEVPVW
ncbi:MAG TPA: hypothetical protein VNZ04_05965 [Trinickia sp.]|nr:hypothetical protein [Trinickia sp.]